MYFLSIVGKGAVSMLRSSTSKSKKVHSVNQAIQSSHPHTHHFELVAGELCYGSNMGYTLPTKNERDHLGFAEGFPKNSHARW